MVPARTGSLLMRSVLIAVVLSSAVLGVRSDGTSKPDSLCQKPRVPLKTCYMVDYPVYLSELRNLSYADENANEKWINAVANEKAEQFLQTEECANSIRAFKCVLTLMQCDKQQQQPLPPCKSTCNAFVDVCYAPELRAKYAETMCQHFPDDEEKCSAVPMPPPPPPVWPPPVEGRGLQGEIVNMDLKLPMIGGMSLSIRNISLHRLSAEQSITADGSKLLYSLQNGKARGTVEWYIQQKSFPRIASHGRLHFETSINAFIKLLSNREKHDWDITYSKVTLPLEEMHHVNTSFKWAKDLFLKIGNNKIRESAQHGINTCLQENLLRLPLEYLAVFSLQNADMLATMPSTLAFARSISEPPFSVV